MTKKRLSEIKITNQILAALVVVLSLGLGYFLAKDQGWLRKPYIAVNSSERNYVEGELDLEATPFSRSIIERTIFSRRTRRQFSSTSISVDELTKLTWSLQGVTADWGGRVVPTIKSSYPLEISVVVRAVEGLEEGVYHYIPKENKIKKTQSEIPNIFDDLGNKIPSLVDAPVIFVISGNASKISNVLHSEDVFHLLYLEAGHAAQNLFLVSESMNMGVNPISQFDAPLLKEALKIPGEESPLYILPVGYPEEV